MGTLERLKDFHFHLKEQGYGGRNVFEREIGVSEGYLSHMKRKGVNSDVLERVAELFPQLNIHWLLTGEGEMLNSDKSSETELEANDEIIRLHRELEEAYKEIGRLNMELRSAKQHNLISKRG